MSKTVKAILIVALVGVLGVGLYFLITSQLNARKARSYDEFVQLIMDEKNERSEEHTSELQSQR